MTLFVDLVVIGAGPAGLTAGIYAARAGLKVIILEALKAGGLIAENALIENYPGFPSGISGFEFANRLVEQAVKNGVEVREGEPVRDVVRLEDGRFLVKTDEGEYECYAVILATGTRRKKLGVKGEEEFRGRGVSYCAVCDGPLFRGRKVAVVGGGNTAVSEAIYLSSLASKVYLIHRRNALRAEEALQKALFNKNNVEVLWNTVVKEIVGEEKVYGVKVADINTGEVRSVDVDGVFIAIGEEPNNELAKKLGLALTEEGYVKVDLNTMETSIPGVYAAGDITGVFKQAAVAVGQGALAANSAYNRIQQVKAHHT